MSSVNPRVGVIDVQPMLAFVGRAQAQTKFALVLIGGLRRLSRSILAAVGLYSVLSTTVRQRQAEIGVRMAFGAEHGRIFRMMVGAGPQAERRRPRLRGRRGARPDATSSSRCSWAWSRPTRRRSARWRLGFLLIAAVACGVPALRAARLDPMVALRDDY